MVCTLLHHSNETEIHFFPLSLILQQCECDVGPQHGLGGAVPRLHCQHFHSGLQQKMGPKGGVERGVASVSDDRTTRSGCHALQFKGKHLCHVTENLSSCCVFVS